jgi:hypothetical protein
MIGEIKLGNIKFVAELYNQGIIQNKIIDDCVEFLLENINDLNVRVLCELIKKICVNFSEENKEKLNIISSKLEKLYTNNDINTKTKFFILDCLDLKKIYWGIKGDHFSSPKELNKDHKKDMAKEINTTLKLQLIPKISEKEEIKEIDSDEDKIKELENFMKLDSKNSINDDDKTNDMDLFDSNINKNNEYDKIIKNKNENENINIKNSNIKTNKLNNYIVCKDNISFTANNSTINTALSELKIKQGLPNQQNNNPLSFIDLKQIELNDNNFNLNKNGFINTPISINSIKKNSFDYQLVGKGSNIKSSSRKGSINPSHVDFLRRSRFNSRADELKISTSEDFVDLMNELVSNLGADIQFYQCFKLTEEEFTILKSQVKIYTYEWLNNKDNFYSYQEDFLNLIDDIPCEKFIAVGHILEIMFSKNTTDANSIRELLLYFYDEEILDGEDLKHG